MSGNEGRSQYLNIWMVNIMELALFGIFFIDINNSDLKVSKNSQLPKKGFGKVYGFC